MGKLEACGRGRGQPDAEGPGTYRLEVRLGGIHKISIVGRRRG